VLLGKVLNNFAKLFNGTLGKHPHCKALFKAEPNATPVHSKPCLVAKMHEQIFKNKLKHLCAIGALERCGATEWAALQPSSFRRKMGKCNGFPIFAPSTKSSSAQNPRHFEQTERMC
jgi:hypothetical protein